MQSFIGLGCYIESPHRVIFIIYLRIYVVKTDILLQEVYVSGAIVTRDLRFRFLAFEDSVVTSSGRRASLWIKRVLQALSYHRFFLYPMPAESMGYLIRNTRTP